MPQTRTHLIFEAYNTPSTCMQGAPLGSARPQQAAAPDFVWDNVKHDFDFRLRQSAAARSAQLRVARRRQSAHARLPARQWEIAYPARRSPPTRCPPWGRRPRALLSLTGSQKSTRVCVPRSRGRSDPSAAMEDLCAVCCDPLQFVAVSRCNHTEVCAACTARLRMVVGSVEVRMCQRYARASSDLPPLAGIAAGAYACLGMAERGSWLCARVRARGGPARRVGSWAVLSRPVGATCGGCSRIRPAAAAPVTGDDTTL